MKATIVSVGGMLAFCLVIGCAVSTGPTITKQRGECSNTLKCIAYGIDLYQGEHDMAWPKDIMTLSNELLLPIVLHCPGSRDTVAGFDTSEQWSSYRYVNWTRFMGTNKPPNDYPLVYDRRLANHHGDGINIMRVDFSVMWDPHAQWLIKFSRAHPDYKILIPR